MRRVLVLGATGQLGSDVVDAFGAAGDHTIGMGHDDLDVVDDASVAEVIAGAAPDVIVNTTAFHNLQRCEQEPAAAYAVNATGARAVARAATAAGATLVHISTDYVFDGHKGSPYVESDLAAPLNVYGASKLAGEALVRAECERSFVVRTSGLYGARPCRAKGGLNFPSLMLKLARENGALTVVGDQVVGPTYTPDLARQLVALVATDGYGIVHATGVGEVSWHGFAVETLRLAGLPGVPVNRSSSEDQVGPGGIRRPAYSILAHQRLDILGVDVMRPWQEALAEYVASLA